MTDRLTGLARHLRECLTPADPPTDADLLGRFADRRDEPAFAELVRRHGPLVLGVCRRVLRDPHDADDAFQATFLVLARKAGAVRRAGHPPAAWLHGVAYRTALEARRAAAVRRAKEQRAAAMRATELPPPDAPDLRAVLDHELALLPEAYRAAVALCDLEGLPRAEAARRLGWTAGTLSGRLARARALLAKRLAGRGLTAAGVAVPVVAADAVARAVRVGVLIAAGGSVATVAPAPVAALTEGVLKAMFLTKLKGTAAGLMVACAVVVTGVAGWDTAVARPQEPAAAGRRAPNPDKERIAQLEKERAELLKKLADLQARLDALEGQKLPLRVGGERVVLTGELPVIGEKLVVREGVRLVDKAAPADERVPALHVYPVADLTAGDPDGQSIIRLITATVAPDSWRAAGGPGVVEYFAPTKSLVVRHTADAHKQLAELLKLLRVKPVGE